MTEPNPTPRIDQFIIENIDTVPHLEALLLAWNNRPRTWSAEEMGAALYLQNEAAEKILRDLAQRGLLQDAVDKRYQYVSSAQQDELMGQLEATYRRELIRLTRMIHAKAPSALRDFARAFRFTKEKE
jgi:predicted ArsR family transcriptional regulator